MATNNFKPFATAANANVMSQADWEALPALLSGFISGPAKSAQVNKAIRQASFIAAALAQYTANKSGMDVLDDGDLNGFISKMGTAFGKDFQALDATLTALAGLATGANKLPYFTGNDTAAQTDLTSVGRDIIGKNTIADILTYLGLVKPLSGANWRQTADGYIEQWGTSAGAVSGRATVTFPIPFPSACESIQLTEISGGSPGDGTISWGLNPAFTKTGFSAVSTNTFVAEPVMWRALGK
ncbi:gp53-like domain-containing protein [Atlantibacter subterraneus]|uniref:gp53-like domain-containing protein n=1 Tax=Atlantibacter subterraneus TaxID=255519 RepID=UPI0028B18FEE|nr:phage tail protein [Atlantibacter subterranea]